MTSPNRYASSTYNVRCPHCDGGMKVRSSKEQTRLVRDVYLRCDTDECGFTALAQLEIIATLSPSSRPHANVVLPLRAGRPPPSSLPTPANDSHVSMAEA